MTAFDRAHQAYLARKAQADQEAAEQKRRLDESTRAYTQAFVDAVAANVKPIFEASAAAAVAAGYEAKVVDESTATRDDPSIAFMMVPRVGTAGTTALADQDFAVFRVQADRKALKTSYLQFPVNDRRSADGSPRPLPSMSAPDIEAALQQFIGRELEMQHAPR